MSITRRGFIGVLSGAIAAAAGGITLPKIADGVLASVATPSHIVNARHIYAFDMHSPMAPCWVHRIDVICGNQQWGVDLATTDQTLNERQLMPALSALNNAIGSKLDQHYKVGKIFTFSQEEWAADKAAQRAWGRLGDANAGRLS